MAPSIRTIRSYATQEKFSVDFFGDEIIVTVTPDPSVIGQWIHDVLFSSRRSSHPLLVGLGVYWTPNRSRSDPQPVQYRSDSQPVRYRSRSPPPVRHRSPEPEADTLQLCVGNRCIIIQLSRCHRVPNVLRRFLEDGDNTFVGVWNSQDAKKLEESRHQLEVVRLLDLRVHIVDSTGSRTLSNCSFEEIVEENLGHRGVRLERAISMSNWSVEYLSDDQILQATIDAYCSFKLGVLDHLWEKQNYY
ncbi:PREDICTED: uncharacterized protein LOC104748155 [Camelina sativa]|uniref:Uncharacterized protein LOC104748155 n=1 Tax=Camelina sativa TaxID=90675 RepID=A0ABM0WAL4_CAMSA|nr:PREDICTED: uncharacterized protein LOC104748155 [Camelina sativa]